MEIKIKTYDEVSSERVTIEVAPGQRAEIQIFGDQQEVDLSAADQAEETVSGEAAWYQVALDRKAEIRVLRAQVRGLEKTLAESRVADQAYDPEAAVEAMAGNYQRAKDRIAELEQRLGAVRVLVFGVAMEAAMSSRGTPTLDGYSVIMGGRLAAVRGVVGDEGSLSSRLYTAEEVGDAQASEAELVATPLRRRVAELEAELSRKTAEWKKNSAEGRAQVERLVKRAEEAEASERAAGPYYAASVVNGLRAELARYNRAHVCVKDCGDNEHVAFVGRTLVTELETDLVNERAEVARQDAEIHRAYDALIKTRAERGEAEADLARSRADWEQRSAENRTQVGRLLKRAARTATRLALREKDAATFQRQRDEYVAGLNAQEYRFAEERRISQQSIAARDNLLRAATTKIEVVRSILAAPKVTKTRDEIVTSKGVILADAISNALAALDDN